LDWPLEVRLVLIFFGGLILGGQLNRGIYRLAWHPRRIGPWSSAHADAPQRHWFDRLPVLGWLTLRRESPLHGAAFWVRPLLIELATGLGLAALYWYEVHKAGVFSFSGVPAPATEILHAQFFAHVVLISLMVVATFIDFDEQTIPDAITVWGAISGLTLAALLPISRPLVSVAAPQFAFGFSITQLHLASPAEWPSWLDGPRGLGLGLACFFGWWLAVLPWTWTMRWGLKKAVAFYVASLLRRVSIGQLAIAVLGGSAITIVWLLGADRWESLLSSLVGMAFGGGLIWAVRIVGSHALRQEAMGFGDVTLMAMIGTFTGWQATLIVFFLAPFAAVVISVSQWVLTRRKDIAFGPYLCLSALFVVVRWGDIWNGYARQVFALGWMIPALAAVCLLLMGAMLVLMRLFREATEEPHEPAHRPQPAGGLDSVAAPPHQGPSTESDTRPGDTDDAELQDPTSPNRS
jgi:prepilin signal peptidase PulO-like enzyme (type II secretory pathway)